MTIQTTCRPCGAYDRLRPRGEWLALAISFLVLLLAMPAASAQSVSPLPSHPTVELPVSQGRIVRFNEPVVLASGVPGAGAVGTAADVATYYQALLHNPGGLWDPAVLADATANVRNTLIDPLFNCPANRTLGLVVAGDDDKSAVRGFGAHTSARAFGCLGVGGQIAWADPDSGLSFSYLTSGLDVDIVASFIRSAKIAGLAARCTS